MKTHLDILRTSLLILVLASVHLCAQPVNDMFTNRTEVTGLNTTLQQDDTGATTESGEPGLNDAWWASVWYEWTAPTNGIFYVGLNTYNLYGFFLRDNVYYQGNSVTNLTNAVATPDGGFEVVQGQVLEVQVVAEGTAEVGGQLGPFAVQFLEEAVAPVSGNDMFSNRVEIMTPGYHFDGEIYGASAEPGEPLPAPTDTNTLWWDFVAPSDGVLYLRSSSPVFAPILSVFAGSNFSTMTAADQIQPNGILNYGYFLVYSGQEYVVQVAASFPNTGQVSLDAYFNSQSFGPTSDMFATATQVFGTNVFYYGDYSTATLEAGEPPAPAGNTVWVAWVPPSTGHAYYLFGGPYHYVQAYTGPSLAHLKPLTVKDIGNDVFSFLALQNTVYYFRLSGAGDNFLFYITENIFSDPPANDNFADAIPGFGNSPSFGPSSVIGATMEPCEPAHMGSTPEKSVWWYWQAPEYGTLSLGASSVDLVQNPEVAVYTGNTVGTLSEVANGVGSVQFPVAAGQIYRIAGAAPTNAIGDIALSGNLAANTSVHPVPENLLHEPSWEGTGIFDAVYWQTSGNMGGYVDDDSGDCDGTTWPVLLDGASVWQSFTSVPGHIYQIRFGFTGASDYGGGDASVDVLWNSNLVGVASLPATSSGYWNWTNFLATASSNNTTVLFTSSGGPVAMDVFSVVDQTAPPAIVASPAPESVESGGAAAFYVNASGTAPLSYQWFFQNLPLDGQTNLVLYLTNAYTNFNGSYFVIVSNNFGMATSEVASLLVDAPSFPTIVQEPYGESVVQGGFFSLGVAAVGSQPLSYQWSLNGSDIVDATNDSLTFADVQTTNAGVYRVTVTNSAGAVGSLPATLTVTESDQGGGLVLLANQFPPLSLYAPIYDIDGVTKVNGNCVAQLYAGPSLAELRAVGMPVAVGTGFGAGYISYSNAVVTLPNVSPGADAIVQVRAWDPSVGGTYELARALGGKFGKSGQLQIVAGGGGTTPTILTGLQSFSLTAGLPEFEVGEIQFNNSLSDGSLIWSLTGDSGYIYLVEQADSDNIWNPYLILTNTTGTINFTNTVGTNSGATFYRARILD